MVKRFNVNLLQQQRALLFHIASKIYCHRLRVVSFSCDAVFLMFVKWQDIDFDGMDINTPETECV